MMAVGLQRCATQKKWGHYHRMEARDSRETRHAGSAIASGRADVGWYWITRILIRSHLMALHRGNSYMEYVYRLWLYQMRLLLVEDDIIAARGTSLVLKGAGDVIDHVDT
jgi:hypothetical protein